MTEREKELRGAKKTLAEKIADLMYEVFGGCESIDEIDKQSKFIAKLIPFLYDEGYTKKHFPVEELEAWLREEKQKWIIRDCDNIQGDLRYKALEDFCQAILDKTKELKGE
jgi:hypothetical protein